jgi:hypothetical protein
MLATAVGLRHQDTPHSTSQQVSWNKQTSDTFHIDLKSGGITFVTGQFDDFTMYRY